MRGSSRNSWVRWGLEACVALLAMTTFAGCSCSPTPPQTITAVAPSTSKSAAIGADFKVTPGTITLNWSNGETVAWHNQSASTVVIRFHTYDHEIAEVVPPNSWSAIHRAVARGVHGYKIYEVKSDGTLRDTSGDPPAEPKIDVGP